ncbi:MDM12_5 [Sanghuangporus weigelae]
MAMIEYTKFELFVCKVIGSTRAVSRFLFLTYLDLAWDKLDNALAQRLVDILNRSIAKTPRPSFIGPVEVTGLDFGTVPPDIEVVDLRDIYRDFLEDDEDGISAGGGGDTYGRRKAKGRAEGERMKGEDSATYHPLPPHMRYSGAASVPNLADLRPGLGLHARGMGLSASMYSAPPPPPPSPPSANVFSPDMSFGVGERRSPFTPQAPPSSAEAPSTLSAASSTPSSNSAPTPTANLATSTHPNIQIHFRILHHSDLRLSLTTSLIINYPSPLFLSLPIKLAVTCLEFIGEVALAYEGASSPRRIHFCLLDDLDPYGLATGAGSLASRDGGMDPAAKPLPVGKRLLPSIFIESEIGHADKHVLRNVTRVERFIQDVIRRIVEDELVFPNFHTIILGE